jgi:hypothetical protein
MVRLESRAEGEEEREGGTDIDREILLDVMKQGREKTAEGWRGEAHEGGEEREGRCTVGDRAGTPVHRVQQTEQRFGPCTRREDQRSPIPGVPMRALVSRRLRRKGEDRDRLVSRTNPLHELLCVFLKNFHPYSATKECCSLQTFPLEL